MDGVGFDEDTKLLSGGAHLAILYFDQHGGKKVDINSQELVFPRPQGLHDVYLHQLGVGSKLSSIDGDTLSPSGIEIQKLYSSSMTHSNVIGGSFHGGLD